MRIAIAALALATAASCAGDGVLPTEGGGVPSGPTLASLQSSIFTPRCAVDGCHAGTDPQQGLDLSGGESFAHLVGVPSTELAEFDRVSPGSSADSYVLMKLLGDPRIAGSQMPLIGPALEPVEIDALRRWIDAGAKND